MKVLLTGGAGYIGSHTCIELINAGFEPIIADNFSNSKPEAVKRINEITGVDVTCFDCDVSDYESLSKIFSENKIDFVIHFAGFKAVGESTELPLKYYRNNIDTSLTLLEVMAEYNCKNIVFSSSATVYGQPNTVEYSEDMPTGNCTNPYAWTKMMIEHILMDAAAADEELCVILLRYFNPIGAHESGRIGEDPNGIPNNLLPYITQVAIGRREHLNVFGNDYPTRDGTGVRDYIHVVDLAKGHVAALKYAENYKGTEIFNLGSGKGFSVLEVIKAFEKASGKPLPYKIAPARAGDIAECYANPQKAKKILCWETKKSLDDMCADSWKWQKNNPNGYQ